MYLARGIRETGNDHSEDLKDDGDVKLSSDLGQHGEEGDLFVWVYGISIFVGYLMPNPFLYE